MRRILPVLSLWSLVLGALPSGAQEPATASPAVAAAPAGAGDDAATAPAYPAQPADAPRTAESGGREDELSALLPRLALDDELLWLEAGGKRFFAFRRAPARDKPRGAILIVPAPGRFIDETPLIRSLRNLPPAGGYSTLAVQPPLAGEVVPAPTTEPATSAGSDPLCARLSAALTALVAEGAPLVAIAAEAGSVQAVLDCNGGAPPPGVQAFAAIGRWQGSFDALDVPSIEFVPMRDTVAVAAAERRAAKPAAPGAPPRRRVDLDGVDGHFDGADVEIAKRLRGWLERLPPPTRAAAAG